MGLFGKKGDLKAEPTRLFYACDIHGSEPTYRKFLNAAKFYDVDALVFGGDLMGKLLVPIVSDAGGVWRAGLHGQKHVLTTPEELAEFKKRLDTLGFYWFECDSDEYRWYEGHQDRIDQKFDELAKARLAEWVELAEHRLAGTHVRVYLCGGNDDTEKVLSALDEVSLDRVVNCENRIVPLDDDHTLATIGYSTPTPWDTPRERTDEQIGELIEKLMADVAEPSRCVFNFHCPPLDSGLDTCMKLDASVCPFFVSGAGGQTEASSFMHVSSPESSGGQWKLKTHLDGSDTSAMSFSMSSPICSSVRSRGVSHGVGVE